MVPARFRQFIIRLVIIFLGFSLLLIAVSLTIHHPSTNDLTQTEPQPVSRCTVISQEGAYKLTQDIQGGKLADSCIQVNESHVILQGRGHTLHGNGVTDSTAISISHPRGVTDVTVRSVKTTRWNRGIHIANASDVTIQNISAWRNAEGIAVWNSTTVTISDVRLTRNLFGLVVDQSSHQIALSSAHIERNVAGNVSWGDYQSRSNSTVTTSPSAKIDRKNVKPEYKH